MNGEQRLNAAVPVVVCIEQTVVDRHQRRLPVVRVDHIRLKFNVRQHLQNGTGEERKALRVVKVTVKSLALKVVLVIDEVVNDIAYLRLKNTAILATPSHRHTDAC